MPKTSRKKTQQVKRPPSNKKQRAQAALHKGADNAGEAAWGILGALVDAARSSRIVLVVLILLALLLFSMLFDTVANHGKVHSGVYAGTVDIGGLAPEQIQEKVSAVYAERLSSAGVTIYGTQEALNDRSTGFDESYGDEVSIDEERRRRTAWSTDSASLQAYIDYDALVQYALAAGRQGPLDRLALLFSTREIEVPVNFNETIVESLAHEIDLSIGLPLVNYGIDITDGYVSVTPGKDGEMINRDTFKHQLAQELLSEKSENRAFLATTEHTPVQIGQDDAQKVADKVNTAISQGMLFTCNGTEWYAAPSVLGNWIQTAVSKDESGVYGLSPSFSLQEARTSILSEIQPTFEDGQGSIRFSKENNTLMVSVTSSGTFPLVGDAIEHLNMVYFGSKEVSPLETKADGTPVVNLQSAQIPEHMSLDEALSFGVVSSISEFTTEYTTGAVERNHNIHLAADLVTNSIIPAHGGIWSFNETAGECNEAKGFQAAKAVAGDQLIDEIGGGICQVATTIFNAVYEAGLPIKERHNHSIYFASYPQGRDAAISWPSPDLKWENESSSDMLLVMSYTDSSVTATIYGEELGYTVESVEGEWLEGQEATTVYETDETLAPGVEYIKTYGENGHTITVTRTVKDRKGEVVHEDSFVSVYSPQNTVVVQGSYGSSASESSYTPTF